MGAGRPTNYNAELAASIYGLYDADGRLRYIGKAIDPEKRLKGHLYDSAKKNTPVCLWIRKNGKPVMKILEASCRDWREAERRIIADARRRGEPLLNVADGGDQPYCSDEVRASNARKATISRPKHIMRVYRRVDAYIRQAKNLNLPTLAKLKFARDSFARAVSRAREAGTLSDLDARCRILHERLES